MCYPGVYDRKACSDRIQERARRLTDTTGPTEPEDNDPDDTPDTSTDEA